MALARPVVPPRAYFVEMRDRPELSPAARKALVERYRSEYYERRHVLDGYQALNERRYAAAQEMIAKVEEWERLQEGETDLRGGRG